MTLRQGDLGMGDVSAGRLKASARGALIGGLFGSAWMFWAVLSSGHTGPPWRAAVAVPAIALTAWAILCMRASRGLKTSDADLAHWRTFRGLFWAATLIEWGSIVLAALLLGRVGRFDLLPPTAGVIVGLHFFPLAVAFRTRRYYWLGGIMIIGACSCLLVSRSDLRATICCAFMGLCLWGSSAAALRRLSFTHGRTAASMAG